MLGAAEPGVEILYTAHMVHMGTERQSDKKKSMEHLRTVEKSSWHSFNVNHHLEVYLIRNAGHF